MHTLMCKLVKYVKTQIKIQYLSYKVKCFMPHNGPKTIRNYDFGEPNDFCTLKSTPPV